PPPTPSMVRSGKRSPFCSCEDISLLSLHLHTGCPDAAKYSRPTSCARRKLAARTRAMSHVIGEGLSPSCPTMCGDVREDEQDAQCPVDDDGRELWSRQLSVRVEDEQHRHVRKFFEHRCRHQPGERRGVAPCTCVARARRIG